LLRCRDIWILLWHKTSCLVHFTKSGARRR
jgi:hypothetical protein